MRCRWYLGMSIDGNNQYVLSGWPTGVAFLFCESNSLRRSNPRVVEEIYSVCQFIGLTFSAEREHMLRQGPSKRRNSASDFQFLWTPIQICCCLQPSNRRTRKAVASKNLLCSQKSGASNLRFLLDLDCCFHFESIVFGSLEIGL